MDALIRDLCAFACGVVADENRALFDRIQKELPLTLFRFPSGSSFNGWLIPDNWRVQRANLYREGRLMFDGLSHTLGVGRNSSSFTGTLTWEQLEPHLVTNPELADAYMFHCIWQYRPWDRDWALCMPYEIYKQLGPGNYRVELDTCYTPGEMLVAHHHKHGRSDNIVVFNAHTCHPHMANDGFAGVAVLIRLFQWLADRDTHYAYRLVLGPEHLGSVFYLNNLPEAEISKMVSGAFVEMTGTKGALKAASTYLGRQIIDHAFENTLRHHSKAYDLVAWRKGAGNDETVWEAPGYEVPFVELTRCESQWAPYREYHTSLDDPNLMVPEQLDEVLAILQKVVEILEDNVTIHRRFDGLICLSNPHYDLYMERPDPAVAKDLDHDAESWGHLLDCLFRYMDGSWTLLEIAQKHNLPFDRLRRYLERFEEKGLVELRRVEIPRKVPERALS